MFDYYKYWSPVTRKWYRIKGRERKGVCCLDIFCKCNKMAEEKSTIRSTTTHNPDGTITITFLDPIPDMRDYLEKKYAGDLSKALQTKWWAKWCD